MYYELQSYAKMTVVNLNEYLHESVKRGDCRSVCDLVLKGANVNARDSTRKTCLEFAVESRDVDMMQCLLDNGAQVDAFCGSTVRVTPLHAACERGTTEMVQLLINYGANIHALTGENLSPILIAIRRGHKRISLQLLERGADPNSTFDNGDSILFVAASKGLFTVVVDILSFRPDINSINNKYAIRAALRGHCRTHKQIITCLYNWGFSLGADDYTDQELIYAAIRRGSISIVSDLIENGLDVNMKLTVYPLSRQKTSCLLHVAVEALHLHIVKMLLKCGADVNIKDSQEKTPLLLAAERNNHAIFKLLIEKGASIHDTDVTGHTALHLTILYKLPPHLKRRGLEWENYLAKDNMVDMLCSRGININAQTTPGGMTALHIASCLGQSNIVHKLLQSDADINIENARNWTPLDYALDRLRNASSRRNMRNGEQQFRVINNGRTAARIVTYRILQTHAQLLYGAEAYVSERNMTAIDGYYPDKMDAKILYEHDLQKLKTRTIGNSNITFHQIIVKDINLIAKMLGNEEINRTLLAYDEYHEEHSRYADIINNRHKHATIQRNLNGFCEDFVKTLITPKCPEMPQVCFENIVRFFNDNEKYKIYNEFYVHNKIDTVTS